MSIKAVIFDMDGVIIDSEALWRQAQREALASWGATVSEDDIKSYVRDHLARYKVPREVVFLDELPRNPTGKILKKELRKPYWEGRDRATV